MPIAPNGLAGRLGALASGAPPAQPVIPGGMALLPPEAVGPVDAMPAPGPAELLGGLAAGPGGRAPPPGPPAIPAPQPGPQGAMNWLRGLFGG